MVVYLHSLETVESHRYGWVDGRFVGLPETMGSTCFVFRQGKSHVDIDVKPTEEGLALLGRLAELVEQAKADMQAALTPCTSSTGVGLDPAPLGDAVDVGELIDPADQAAEAMDRR